MKIAYCLESTALWGGVKVVFEQAEGLAARGHHIVIVAREVLSPWRDAPCSVRTVSKSWEQEDFSSFDLVIATDRPHALALAKKDARLVYLVQSDAEPPHTEDRHQSRTGATDGASFSGPLALGAASHGSFALDPGAASSRKKTVVAGGAL